MPVTGNSTGFPDIQAKDRHRFWEIWQFCTTFFAVGKLREGKGLTGRAFDRFWFWWFTATAVRIT
jgi:hypothetical protein